MPSQTVLPRYFIDCTAIFARRDHTVARAFAWAVSSADMLQGCSSSQAEISRRIGQLGNLNYRMRADSMTWQES